MQKSRIPIIILISVIVLIFSISMLLSGCGRRARIARALQDQESESAVEQGTQEDVTIEDTIESETSEEIEDVSLEETTEIEETAEATSEETVEESMDETEEDQAEESAEEVGEEETSEDEEPVETVDVLTACCESGYIEQGHGVVKDTHAIIGDNEENFRIVAFVTFNISGYEGVDINYARIKFSGISIDYGDPFELGPDLIVNIDNYGELDGDDFAPGGTHLYSEPLEGISEFTITGGNSSIKDVVQSALDSGQDYLQLRLECSKSTNDDDFADRLRFEFDNVKLRISY